MNVTTNILHVWMLSMTDVPTTFPPDFHKNTHHYFDIYRWTFQNTTRTLESRITLYGLDTTRKNTRSVLTSCYKTIVNTSCCCQLSPCPWLAHWPPTVLAVESRGRWRTRRLESDLGLDLDLVNLGIRNINKTWPVFQLGNILIKQWCQFYCR